MAAAPQNGTATFRGRSGRLYTVDTYVSDVAAAQCTFNPNGAAGTASLTYWRPPEPVQLVDFSVVTGLTDTKGAIALQDAAIIPGGTIRWANQLNTLPFRPALNVAFAAGGLIGLQQF
jgi:hypothetical protein